MLGYAYHDKKDYENAIKFYKQALETYDKINYRNTLYAYALNNLGLVYENKKDVDNAAKFYKQSLETYDKLN